MIRTWSGSWSAPPCLATGLGSHSLSHSATGMPANSFGENQEPLRMEMSQPPRVSAVSTATSQALLPSTDYQHSLTPRDPQDHGIAWNVAAAQRNYRGMWALRIFQS